MIVKKFLFPVFVLLAVFFASISCQKKPINKPVKKSNLVEIDRLIELGEKHYKTTKYDSAYYYFSKAKSLCNVKKDTAKIIYSILKLAYIEHNQGNYSASETTILEAFPYLKNNPRPNHHWALYNIMGNNYLQTLDYKSAIYYYNLALHLKTNKFRKACVKSNIALTYMEMHNYKKTIQLLLPLTLEKDVINDTEVFSIILSNLGYSLYKLENQKGIDYMNQSFKIRKQSNNDWGLVSSYINFSEYYQKSNPKLANEYAQ